MNQIAAAILETYRRNWRHLDWEKQRHLSFRLAVLFPHSVWPRRFRSLNIKTFSRLQQLVIMDCKQRLEFARRRLAKLKLGKLNDKTKTDFILRHPQELYFHTLLFDLFYTQNRHPRLMNEALRLALTPAAMAGDPVWAINTICLAPILGGPDRIASGIHLFRQAYPVGVAQDAAAAANYAYGITHWIIGGTNFYTRPLPSNHPGAALLAAAAKEIVNPSTRRPKGRSLLRSSTPRTSTVSPSTVSSGQSNCSVEPLRLEEVDTERHLFPHPEGWDLPFGKLRMVSGVEPGTVERVKVKSADIGAEILLCFKIIDQHPHAHIARRVNTQILLCYDRTCGRLVMDKDDNLNTAEHRNIMTIMAHWWSGPSDPRGQK